MIGFDLRPLEEGHRWVLLAGCDEPGDTVERLFQEACQAITREHHKRDKAKTETREWTQLVCYDLLQLTMQYHHVQLLEDRIARFGRGKVTTVRVNPFHRGLLGIYAHEKGLMDDGDRFYFGRRLWYAYRHYVPTCFLKGFLHQVWSAGAEQRADQNYIETDFAEWVIRERLKDEDTKLRGQYPKDLERQIRGLRNIIGPMREVAQRQERMRAKRAELLDRHFDD